jgi:LysR family transcriptional activator of nhaA
MPTRRRVARQPVCLVGPPMAAAFKLPDDLSAVRLLLPGKSSDIRSQFDLLCESWDQTLAPYAEVDDMAMLRLLARDFGGVAVVPEVVVQDELQSGRLQRYAVLPDVYEQFYAITTQRYFASPLLKGLIDQADASALART